MAASNSPRRTDTNPNGLSTTQSATRTTYSGAALYSDPKSKSSVKVVQRSQPSGQDSASSPTAPSNNALESGERRRAQDTPYMRVNLNDLKQRRGRTARHPGFYHAASRDHSSSPTRPIWRGNRIPTGEYRHSEADPGFNYIRNPNAGQAHPRDFFGQLRSEALTVEASKRREVEKTGTETNGDALEGQKPDAGSDSGFTSAQMVDAHDKAAD